MHIEVTGSGNVDSLYPYYKAADGAVCPHRIGGLAKVKVLEALRAGKAIVSTSVGAEGLNLNKEVLCICDKIFDFHNNNVIRFLVKP